MDREEAMEGSSACSRNQRENIEELMSTKDRWDTGLDNYYLQPKSMALAKLSLPHAAQVIGFSLVYFHQRWHHLVGRFGSLK